MSKASIFFAALFLLSCCCSTISGTSPYVAYKDPKQPIHSRVEDLLRRMSLEEKIGQMVQIEQNVASPYVMQRYLIGSVLSGGGNSPAPKASPETWVNMVNRFQLGSLSTRLGIPMIYGSDAVHGNNNADPELVKRIGAATAREVRATGINYAFAPCVAVCRDPRWGRCFESYSENPSVVRSMTEIIPGLQGDVPKYYPKGLPYTSGQDKVVACAKHFVGDGGTSRGINEANTVGTVRELLDIHMPAYVDSVSKGVSTVMVSYSSWNGIKMHANRALITGYLKNTLGFKGFVISDWQGIDKITSPPHANYVNSIRVGINAGIDMVMVPYNYKEFIGGLTYLVKKRLVPISRIDDAVRRILRVKFTMGLFEHPLADYRMAKHLGSQENRELAREAVRKSLVLLKNGKPIDERPLLPLPKRARKILVAGTHADDIGNQCGGWTIEWHGKSGNITAGTTILSAVRKTVDPKTEVVFEENPSPERVRKGGYSYAIVVVGERPYSESVGDNAELMLPKPGPEVIENVCRSVKCVVVLVTGRPVLIQPYLAQIDALVAAWLPGSEGQGMADVLFGDYGFGGKLPITWFKRVDQLPMNAGDPGYDPLYPFGFGLSTQPVTGKIG
ncbi:4-glucanase [Striga asiatica]|uniref:4-glucanase n=1 Tax=Striga asiatica TaxID=4170 RepID=A0A5A7QK06_STRAF|nr:4-glucanase [Striga asiatica]